ncbi:MAG TPA: sulfurtransferase-like selenium metabolism protein YedF [Bacteroidales bacterium]|nr:sulfurtransferase-like selenium metabolism protein YedF [Bacteroidales bacterium]
MRIVDTKGQLCPAPLIATKRAIKETPVGESFLVLIDNQTSYANVSRFLKDNNTPFTTGEKDSIWTLTITRTTGEHINPDAEEYCSTDVPHFQKGDFVVAISSDKMGDGDEEFGVLLMTNFIMAIHDLDILPSKMVFYNSGVFLGRKDSEVIELLKDLERMGVALFLCGTCITHYSLKDEVIIGTVSNMFEIVQIMSSAEKVVKP